MTATVNHTATGTEDGPQRTVLCPGCGYDLRGTAGDRCSECGLPLDREALQRSGFPWAHRAKLGRVRAFLATVWHVTSDSRTIQHEAAKPQSPRDAASFRRWVAAVLVVGFAVGVVVLIESDAILEVAGEDPSPFAMLARPPGWMQDLLVPWFAGITMRPAQFAYAFVLALYTAGATKAMFHTRNLPPDYAETVESISGYVTAPLVFLLPAIGAYATYASLDANDPTLLTATWIEPVLLIVIALFVIVAIGGTVFRAGQWRARTAHAGYPTGFLGMGELLLRWAVGCAVLGGLVPWCVGFIRIAIDSFRG